MESERDGGGGGRVEVFPFKTNLFIIIFYLFKVYLNPELMRLVKY